jgi:antitoxin component of RelBE/YafQ-DinJ toxin-antitoxin module
MATNKTPSLQVLIEAETRSQFAMLCEKNGRTMAWAVRAFIDRCLESGAIELAPSPPPAAVVTEVFVSPVVERDNQPTKNGTRRKAIKVFKVQKDQETLENPSVTPVSDRRQKLEAEIERMRSIGSHPIMEAQIEKLLAQLDAAEATG